MCATEHTYMNHFFEDRASMGAFSCCKGEQHVLADHRDLNHMVVVTHSPRSFHHTHLCWRLVTRFMCVDRVKDHVRYVQKHFMSSCLT